MNPDDVILEFRREKSVLLRLSTDGNRVSMQFSDLDPFDAFEMTDSWDAQTYGREIRKLVSGSEGHLVGQYGSVVLRRGGVPGSTAITFIRAAGPRPMTYVFGELEVEPTNFLTAILGDVS